MPDEARLREQARAATRGGSIPTRPADRTWGGPGLGKPCAICQQPVRKNESEFEIEFAQAGSNRAVTLHLHVRCFAAWEFERTKAG